VGVANQVAPRVERVRREIVEGVVVMEEDEGDGIGIELFSTPETVDIHHLIPHKG
jgi:hypothetical protein